MVEPMLFKEDSMYLSNKITNKFASHVKKIYIQ